MTAESGIGLDLRMLGAEMQLVDRRFASAVRKEVRAAVSKEGEAVVAAVRRQAASWSTTIPAAVGMKVSFGARRSGITVAVNARRARHARPYEMGNKNQYDQAEVSERVATAEAAGKRMSRRNAMSHMAAIGHSDRTLRWPVFHASGTDGGWGETATRPFFFPATEAMTPAIEADFTAAIDRAVRAAGFH